MHPVRRLIRHLRVREWVTFGRVGWLRYRLPNYARDTHVYIIGASGTGKSKFLESLFVADVLAGRGCALVDPHGDLATDVLAHLLSKGYFTSPEHVRRVIYFDPTRTEATIPFNVLRTGLPAYTIANQVIEALRRTWPQSLREAPRFTNIALAALLALIEAKRTLTDLPTLLTDASCRQDILAAVKDPHVQEFFTHRYAQWGRGFTIESVLNKVTAFTLNPHLRRCLGTAHNALDFRRLMDAGTVLIVNLGHCDDETRRLIGSLITTGMEQAATQRAPDRRHYYLYLDEFQDFCANEGGTKTLAQTLSECRKYNLHLHLAHQTLGQLASRVESALGNVGIKVVFALDYADAKVLAHTVFAEAAGTLKWEEGAGLIQRLPNRVAFVRCRGWGLARMRTAKIRAYKPAKLTVPALITTLLRLHGVPNAGEQGSRPTSTGDRRPRTFADWETRS
jgi:hypothetical protein